MPGPLIIDCHMHVYETRERAEYGKANYEIWEYGAKQGVHSSQFAGDVEDALDALGAAGASKAVIVNLFGVERAIQRASLELPAELTPQERSRQIEAIEASMGDQLRPSNEWTCDLAKRYSQFVPFIAADPWALPVDEMCEHIADQARNHGARGIKLHGIVQRFYMNDRRMWPIYRTCVEEGLSVIAHSGPAKGSEQFAEPEAFADVLDAFPDLVMVLAHLGGGAWSQTKELAQAYPQASFDCSEIMAWTGGSTSPSDLELAQIIKEIGPERVMMGSDFPWYDVSYSADWVMSLPMLSREEKEGILGANAQRILRV